MSERFVRAILGVVILVGLGALGVAVFGLVRHLVLFGFDGSASC